MKSFVNATEIAAAIGVPISAIRYVLTRRLVPGVCSSGSGKLYKFDRVQSYHVSVVALGYWAGLRTEALEEWRDRHNLTPTIMANRFMYMRLDFKALLRVLAKLHDMSVDDHGLYLAAKRLTAFDEGHKKVGVK